MICSRCGTDHLEDGVEVKDIPEFMCRGALMAERDRWKHMHSVASDKLELAERQIKVKQTALIRTSNLLNTAVPHGPADPDDPCPADCKRCELERRVP